jgi:hypothetical protein
MFFNLIFSLASFLLGAISRPAAPHNPAQADPVARLHGMLSNSRTHGELQRKNTAPTPGHDQAREPQPAPSLRTGKPAITQLPPPFW